MQLIYFFFACNCWETFKNTGWKLKYQNLEIVAIFEPPAIKGTRELRFFFSCIMYIYICTLYIMCEISWKFINKPVLWLWVYLFSNLKTVYLGPKWMKLVTMATKVIGIILRVDNVIPYEYQSPVSWKSEIVCAMTL